MSTKFEIHVSSDLDEDLHFQNDFDTFEEAVVAAPSYDEVEVVILKVVRDEDGFVVDEEEVEF